MARPLLSRGWPCHDFLEKIEAATLPRREMNQMQRLEPQEYRDPVIEAYRDGFDISTLRYNLQLT
jgi:hypothetical protein